MTLLAVLSGLSTKILKGLNATLTINHSLLSIEALRKREIRILGMAFIGERNAETQVAIREMGRVPWLGRLPWLSPLTADTLQAAFQASFRSDDFKP